MTRSIVFLVDQVQDVNILRPLLGLARQASQADISVLASAMFYRRDTTLLWQTELREICGRHEIPIFNFASEFEAVNFLQGSRGLLISSAESNAAAHAVAHNVFRAAPSSYVKVTLQHGLECVGFLHNSAHDRAHGQYPAFNADVICGWFGGDILRSVGAGERSKLYITGPTLLLPQGEIGIDDVAAEAGSRPACLVCENLHSVRLGGTALKSNFIAQFTDFATRAVNEGEDVWLRPHPAGRFTDVKGVALPHGVRKSAGPIYREDMRRYRFAISAPSSILLDFIVAGVPVAVWQDAERQIDCRNYPGLPVISRSGDWWQFATNIERDRDHLLAEQQTFLTGLQIPGNVEERYRDLLLSCG